jgi:hypothetical protein
MGGQPETQGEEAKKRYPPKPRPVVVRIFRALKRCENRRRHRRKTQHQTNELMMARWTRHVGLFTGALVVVGIVTAFIFGRQLNVMQGQLDELHEEQRPWLYVSKITPDSEFIHVNNSISMKVRVLLNNVGHSTARDVRVYSVAIAIPHAGKPGDPIYGAVNPIIGPSDNIAKGPPRDTPSYMDSLSKSICESLAAEHKDEAPNFRDSTIFPGEQNWQSYIILSDTIIEKIVPTEKIGPSFEGSAQFCIRYSFENVYHSTRIVYGIYERSPNDPSVDVTFGPTVRIPREQIDIREESRYAD